jgi:hypothetical protein
VSRSRVPTCLAVAFLTLASLTSACRTAPPRGVLGGEALPVDDVRAGRVFETYRATASARSVLRGSARVAVTGPDFKLNRPQNVVVARPARLRFEVVGLFEQLAAVLVSDGVHYGFYDAATGEMEHGFVTPSLLWELAQVDVEVGEAVGLLLGAPLPPAFAARAAVYEENDGRLAIAFAAPGAARRDCPAQAEQGWHDPACFLAPSALAAGADVFVFDREGRLVELRAFEADGVLRYRARFEQYGPVGTGEARVDFPALVTIDSAGVKSQARFAWKRVMLAGEVSDRLFQLPERGARW